MVCVCVYMCVYVCVRMCVHAHARTVKQTAAVEK